VLEWNRHWQPYWVFTQPSLYELKIERNWLWYFREIDPDVEKRLSELDRWLEAREGWQRYGWLKGRRQRYRWKDRDTEKQRNLEYEHRREILRAHNDFPEVDPAASARRGRLSFRQSILQFRGSETGVTSFDTRQVAGSIPARPIFRAVAQR
jgi:hypothetical protein